MNFIPQLNLKIQDLMSDTFSYRLKDYSTSHSPKTDYVAPI